MEIEYSYHRFLVDNVHGERHKDITVRTSRMPHCLVLNEAQMSYSNLDVRLGFIKA